MADRYQNRPFPADSASNARGENDPLAELARLIGQTDPFGTEGRANPKAQPRTIPQDQYIPEDHYDPQNQYAPQDQYDAELPAEDHLPPGPPPWMRHAVRQENPEQEQDYPSAVHPLHRYAASRAETEPHQQQAPLPHAQQEADPSRYDDALYGRLDSAPEDYPRGEAYSDDPYTYQDGYEDAEEPVERRRGGMVTVAVVLALAVVGTGAAFAYRTYMGSPRSGEPPIIKADNSPTKIVPAPADSPAKLPDRVAAGDGTEKIVPREEAPVDVNAKAGPRVVFPPLNQNNNPPSPASVATISPPATTGNTATAGNGTLPNGEPRKIKTLSVRGDQVDSAGMPVTAPGAAPPPSAKPAPAAKTAAVAPLPASPKNSPVSANASANGPLSISPQSPVPPAPIPDGRVASTNAAQTSGGYLVQVSSQRNEADAQASFRSLQSKFPTVLGSRSPVIKRADLGDKGVYYRAMVGPFGTPDEASQFCGSLKSAGGQCVVQRN